MYKSLKFSKTASAKLQYRINTSIIFNYIRQHGPISRASLSRNLNISAPAVSRVVERLLEEEYVVETEKVKTRTGKRPILVKINDQKGFALGIDLGRGKIRSLLSNFSGEAIKKQWGSAITDSPDIIDKLYEDINTILKNNNYRSLIKTICIGIPAVVDARSGRIVSAPLYGSWKNLDIGKHISKKFGVPVFIENNVNLAALAEKNYGHGQPFSNIFFMEIGNGIGGGIIIDNHLFRGADGSSGEVGFSIVGEKNLKFKIINKGFLEKNASVTSLTKKSIEAIKAGASSIMGDLVKKDINGITPSMVCNAALKGDKLAAKIIQETVELISVVLVNTIILLNPQIVVVGGDICGLPGVKSWFLKPVINFVKGSLPFKTPFLKLSSLGEDAGVTGSAFMAVESLLVGEFPYKIAQEVLS